MTTVQLIRIVCKAVLVLFAMPQQHSNNAGAPKSKNECLELSGAVITGEASPDKNIAVQLIRENRVEKEIRVAASEDFHFQLQKNRQYTIKVRQGDLVPRLICVSTCMPANANETPREFHFDLMQLVKKDTEQTKEASALGIPAAIISYDTLKKIFSYNEKWTQCVKKAYQSYTNS